MTSHDHASPIRPVSLATSRARLTAAIATMATTLARSARSGVSRASRKTPSSEPNVTPAILNASQRNWLK
jgi:hypothetical protein